MQDKCLLHFTGRSKSDEKAYEILKIIVDNKELLMSYCPTFAEESFEKPFMMTCFTDPEKVDIDQHRGVFGKFAVAFNRNSMEEYGANPVLYVTTRNLAHINSQMRLLRKFEDLNKDRDWKEEFEPYQFSEEEFSSFYFIAGLSQELKYKGEKDNYFQSEWRVLYQPDIFLGHDKENMPGMIRPSSMNGKNVGYLKFDARDISYILVPEEYVKQAKDDYPNIEIRTE